MNNFDKHIFNYINESVIDIPRNSLDPTVFQFPDNQPPIMHPIIKTQIMNDIEHIRDLTQVVKYFVVGSILTKKYTQHSDIDVNVQIDAPKDRMVSGIFELIRNLNGNLAAGTTHPINYFVIEKEYDLTKTAAAYDVANEKWIKEPEQENLTVKNYMHRFQHTVNSIDFSVSELRRDIIDFESLKTMDKDEIKNLGKLMEEKLSEIEDDIETLLRSYSNIKTLRRNSFDADMTPKEIRKYGKKSKLPENVIYKMLERYYYFDFIKALKKIIEKDNINSKDVKKIKQLGKDFWK